MQPPEPLTPPLRKNDTLVLVLVVVGVLVVGLVVLLGAVVLFGAAAFLSFRRLP